MNLGDLDFNIGSVNPSGIGTTIYRIPKKDITSWPTIVENLDDLDTGDDITDLSVYEGNFGVATGAVFNKIYSTQGKGKATFEETGETDCKMFLNKATIYFPKLTPELTAFSKAAVNGDFVYLIKHDGHWYVIGSKDYRVTTGPNGDTGDAAGSAKGATINLEAPDTTPLPIYAGTIPVEGGTFDCATDTFTPTPAQG